MLQYDMIPHTVHHQQKYDFTNIVKIHLQRLQVHNYHTVGLLLTAIIWENSLLPVLWQTIKQPICKNGLNIHDSSVSLLLAGWPSHGHDAISYFTKLTHSPLHIVYRAQAVFTPLQGNWGRANEGILWYVTASWQWNSIANGVLRWDMRIQSAVFVFSLSSRT